MLFRTQEFECLYNAHNLCLGSQRFEKLFVARELEPKLYDSGVQMSARRDFVLKNNVRGGAPNFVQ